MTKDSGQFFRNLWYVREKSNQKVVSENFNKLVMKAVSQAINPPDKYLARLRDILNLKNDLVKYEGKNKSLLSILIFGSIDNF